MLCPSGWQPAQPIPMGLSRATSLHTQDSCPLHSLGHMALEGGALFCLLMESLDVGGLGRGCLSSCPQKPSSHTGHILDAEQVRAEGSCIKGKSSARRLACCSLSVRPATGWGQLELAQVTAVQLDGFEAVLPSVCKRVGTEELGLPSEPVFICPQVCCFANARGFSEVCICVFQGQGRYLLFFFFFFSPLKRFPWPLVRTAHKVGARYNLPVSSSLELPPDTNMVLGLWALAEG